MTDLTEKCDYCNDWGSRGGCPNCNLEPSLKIDIENFFIRIFNNICSFFRSIFRRIN